MGVKYSKEELLANRRKRDRERYLSDAVYRDKVLKLRKEYRDKNKETIQQRKREYSKTEKAKKANRARNKKHYVKNPQKHIDRIKQMAAQPQRQFTYIKRRAKRDAIGFDLTLDDFVRIRSAGVCFYCKKELSTTAPNIDRLNSVRGYSLDNCVPCCLECNLVKRDLLSAEEMILFRSIEQGESDQVPKHKFSLYTPKITSSVQKRWGRLLRYSLKKGIPLTVGFDQYSEIIKENCYYCGVENKGTGYGLDRLKPSLGYTLDNVVSCCPPCNQIKGNILTENQMKNLITVIAFFRNTPL